MKLRQHLDFHPFTRHLPTRIRDSLSSLASPALYQAGQVVLGKGDRAERFLLIVDGKVAIRTDCPRRGSVTLQTVGAAEAVGWSWLFEPYESAFEVICEVDVVGVELDARALRELMEEDHELGYRVSKSLVEMVASRLHATRLRLLEAVPSR